MSASIEIKRVPLSSSADLFTKKSEKETNGTSGKRKATKSTRIQLKLDEPTFDNFPEFDFNKLIYIEKVRLTIFFSAKFQNEQRKKIVCGRTVHKLRTEIFDCFCDFCWILRSFPKFSIKLCEIFGKIIRGNLWMSFPLIFFVGSGERT